MAFHGAQDVDASHGNFTDIGRDQNVYYTYNIMGQSRVTIGTPSTTSPSEPGQGLLDGEPPSVEDVEEPQNELTKMFTEEEWTALREFRTNVPSILAEAYPDQPDANATPVKLWNITIDPTNLNDARTSVFLMRVVRAEAMVIRDARKKLIVLLQWRAKWGFERAVEEEFPADLFGDMRFLYGKDKDGRPVLYDLWGANPNCKGTIYDVPRLLRWTAAFYERALSSVDFQTADSITLIEDQKYMTFSEKGTRDKRPDMGAGAGKVHDIYNIFVAYDVVINNPSWMSVVLNPIFSAFDLVLDNGRKIVHLGSSSKNVSRGLLKLIAAKELPKRYGGSADGF